MKNLILKVKKHIKKVLIVIGLVGVASAIVISTPTIPQEQTIGTIPLSISETIKDFSAVAKANYKSREIAKIGSISRVLHGKYEIEITGLNPIEGGVEFYVRAWQDGIPVGLGVGGRFEKEHFIIKNPPILIEDSNGTIIRENNIDGQVKQLKYREDLRETLLQVVEHIIKITGKKGIAVFGSIGNTTLTTYPDAGNPGSTSVDGEVARLLSDANGEVWATIKAGAGTDLDATTVLVKVFQTIDSSLTDKWVYNKRFIAHFDTSSIGAGATISSATLSVFGNEKADGLSIAPTINVYSSTVSSDNTLAVSDYSQTGSTAFATEITYGNISTADYNDFTLNASGIANLNLTGVSKFSVKEGKYDGGTSTPTWGAASQSRFIIHQSDEDGTANDPKLVVVYTAAAGGAIPKIIISE